MRETLPISVVIPSYNRDSWLRECLDSVTRQTVPAREVIVVDDGSVDDTEKVCRRVWPDVTYIYQRNRGVSAARNRGIRAARGEWIAFLDSDDMWLPKKLASQWSYVEKHPDIKIIQTDEVWIRRGQRVNPRKVHKKPSGWVFDELIALCLVSPSAVMIHQSVFAKVGLFDESLPACEDYDLWLRMALHYPIASLDEALTVKRGGHEDQLSQQWGLDQYRIRALEKILAHENISVEQKKLVRSDIKRRCEILILGYEKHGNSEESERYQKLLQRYQSSDV